MNIVPSVILIIFINCIPFPTPFTDQKPEDKITSTLYRIEANLSQAQTLMDDIIYQEPQKPLVDTCP